MRAATTNKVGPKTRATRRPPGQAHSHNKWTDRRGPVTDTTSTSTLSDTTYSRDDNTQLTGATGTGTNPETTETYGHDSLNRLDSYTSGGTTTTPGYDNAGNPTTLSDGTTQTFDAADELTASTTPASDATNSTYDARGNLTAADDTGTSTTQTYGYDQENRLNTYGNGTTTASYTYNGDGLRTAKTVGSTTTAFTWDTQTGAVPLVLTAGSTSYVYGPGDTPIEQIASGGTPTYLQHDQHGSTTLLTNSSGTVTGTYTYTPTGTTATHTGTTSDLRYDGQYQDNETGLYYLQARYYNPTTAQFLTRDPLETETGQPYSYADDEPLDESDPLGLAGPGWWRDIVDVPQDVGYAEYWASYEGIKGVNGLANECGPVTAVCSVATHVISAPAVPYEAEGLLTDTLGNVAKGETIWQEDRPDQPLFGNQTGGRSLSRWAGCLLDSPIPTHMTFPGLNYKTHQIDFAW